MLDVIFITLYALLGYKETLRNINKRHGFAEPNRGRLSCSKATCSQRCRRWKR